MSDGASSSLLGHQSTSQRRSSQQSQSSSSSRRSERVIDTAESTTRNAKSTVDATTESTPLLSQSAGDRGYGDAAPPQDQTESHQASWWRRIRTTSFSKSKTRRWPTIVALCILTIVVLLILGFGFAAPAVVKEYAQEALVFEPQDLSIDSFTSTGVIARVQGDFRLDGSRVKKKAVRDLGRAGTWIAKAVESKETHVEVRLPKYGNVLLGTAIVPPITVSVRDGQVTHIDVLAVLTAGDVSDIKVVAQDWLRGDIDSLIVRGMVDAPLKSGILGLGTQHISQTLVIAGRMVSHPVL